MTMSTEVLEEDVDEEKRQKLLLEYIWKPFLDNLFTKDPTLRKEVILTKEKFKSLYYDKNDVVKSKDNNDYRTMITIPSALSRFNYLIKKLTQAQQEEEEKNQKEREDNVLSPVSKNIEVITKSDILLRKFIQFNLEGNDIYWEGKVIGKRTCLNFFGKLIVAEHPFDIYMIYDDTNEKVIITKSEYLSLCKANINNDSLKYQIKRRRSRHLLRF